MNIVTKQFQDSLQKVGAQLTSPEAKKQVRDLYSKIETKETTSTGGGGYEGPLSGPKMSMWADEAPKKIQAKGGPVEEEDLGSGLSKEEACNKVQEFFNS